MNAAMQSYKLVEKIEEEEGTGTLLEGRETGKNRWGEQRGKH